jgi:hypothetical protein
VSRDSGATAGQQYFQATLLQVRQDVEEGSTLAAAMARHPKVFDQLYTNMVEAGETGGILDLILQRLSTFIEKIVKLKRDVISAMIYPAAVVLMAIGAVARHHDRRDSAVSEHLHGSARSWRAVATTDANRGRNKQLPCGLGWSGRSFLSVIATVVSVKFYYKTPEWQTKH